MILRDVEISLARFIFNEIPIHLIYLPQAKLVDRGEVFKHFLLEVENITEERIHKRCEKETLDRHRAIDDIVKETVRYAIFSHRWLNEGEPSYHQMTAKRYMLKSLQLGLGYKKLKAFCREAEAYGLQFAWSDTCCIDKTSSSELDESIRSMFRWYRNSTICIAYLAASQNVETLAEDVWFTRGWTLQELLAPLRIKFYGKDWARLTEAANDLEHIEILQQIEKATTISIPFLQYHQFEPGPINIAERMGWAANRTTSRGEDSAYCLMGIFGVSLSPAYGEGADQAFFRLTEAIIQVSNNPDILNWAGSPARTSHPTRMLPSSPARYLGRPKLQVIHSPQSLMLTNRGLQLLLLVINAGISKDSVKDPHHTVFLPDRKLIEEEQIELRSPSDSDSVNKGGSCQYGFGFWNLEDGLDGLIVVPTRLIGCLMFRLAPFNWKRLSTREFIVMTPTKFLRSQRLSSRNLETVFL